MAAVSIEPSSNFSTTGSTVSLKSTPGNGATSTLAATKWRALSSVTRFAVIDDHSKIVQLYIESALRKLRIFNYGGVQINETVWKNPGGRLIGMAWTDDLLVCINDGMVYQHNTQAELIDD
ncbi:vacuolar protein sorting-associated protein 16 [Sarracenia purpurea var. burkii]